MVIYTQLFFMTLPFYHHGSPWRWMCGLARGAHSVCCVATKFSFSAVGIWDSWKIFPIDNAVLRVHRERERPMGGKKGASRYRGMDLIGPRQQARIFRGFRETRLYKTPPRLHVLGVAYYYQTTTLSQLGLYTIQ